MLCLIGQGEQMAYLTNRNAPVSGLANLLAMRGRQGDTELVHMSKPEIDMMERMGKMTSNPATGLPEAFSLRKVFRAVRKTYATTSTGCND